MITFNAFGIVKLACIKLPNIILLMELFRILDFFLGILFDFIAILILQCVMGATGNLADNVQNEGYLIIYNYTL